MSASSACREANNQYAENYGDPLWVYYQYRLAKGDARSKDAVYAEGRQKMTEVEGRGVDLATGHGEQIWDLNPHSRPRSTDSTTT
jgi:ethanolamine ammonia-lyase large subunit